MHSICGECEEKRWQLRKNFFFVWHRRGFYSLLNEFLQINQDMWWGCRGPIMNFDKQDRECLVTVL